ncbi:FAD-dependent monooxygenase [Herbiconiux sp. SYSU D00978]|uniref:FAD-dependent monooxygenase n=1 Tax=Herbiconiux sp. SYSU D00978 TaxID=2812562 RepID=UPI001A96419D|nr:FAD-dependent monooxygenase [Herbiconiux sp. SYSU D00978]
MAEILVVGAGIGGLFASRLLATTGHAVTLIERSPAASAVGAGLVLTDAAVHRLAEAGVQVGPIAQRLTALRVTGPRGRSLGGVAHRSALARPELITALSDGLSELADVRFGAALQGIRRDGDRVHCTVAGEERAFDFVVAADGIRSTVRSALAPDVALRSARQVCWRGIVPRRFGDAATELWTGQERIGIVPLTGGRSYVFVTRSTQDAGDDLAPVTGVPRRDATAVEALRSLPREALLRHELWELDRPFWGVPRIALLGDAAHAMTPNTGLGAALAIEDAVVLGEAVGAGLDSAVDRHRRSRGLRVRAAQLASRTIGDFAHSERRVAVTLRKRLGLQRA